jgi:membrane protein
MSAHQESPSSKVKAKVERVDAFQQRHPSLAVPIAVFRKFADDQSTNLASMIAFWAFFSVFPLFLVFVTLLGFFVPARIRGDVLTNVSTMLPLVNASTMQGLSGSWLALVIGLATALWSGLSVVRITQFAFNSVWGMPSWAQPKMVKQIGRSLGALFTVGLGLVISTLLAGFVSGAANAVHLGWIAPLVGYLVTIALDIGLFIAAFRILTDREVTTRDVLPGAVLCGVLFWVLQSLSSLIISRYLHSAGPTYGQFATVITLLWWFYLQSIVTMLGAQLNVVLKKGLHPRPLTDTPETRTTETRTQHPAYTAQRTQHARAGFHPQDR